MSEWNRFFLRAAVVVVVGLAFGWQLNRAWVPNSPAFDFVQLIHPLFDIGVGTPSRLFASFGIGIWIGLVCAMTLDWRKHYHGLLLFIGSLVTIGTVTWFGNLTRIDPAATPNQVAFIVGVAIALLAEVRTIRQTIQRRVSSSAAVIDRVDANVTSVRATRAITGVILFSAVVAAAALFNLTMIGRVTILDPAIGASYAYAMLLFLSYDVRSDTQVIGPLQSGKTYVLIGLYGAFSNRARIALDESEGLFEALQDVANKMPGAGFELPSTEEYDRFWFHYDAGSLFPVRVKFDTYDHRGEYLPDRLAPAAHASKGLRNRIQYLWLSIREQLAERSLLSSLPDQAQLRKLTYDVLNAEQLVVVIDLNRVINPQSGRPHIEELRRVATEVEQNRGDVVLVATKTDILLREVAEGNIDMDSGKVPMLPEASGSEYTDLLIETGVDGGRPVHAEPVFEDASEYGAFAMEVTNWLTRQYDDQMPDLLQLSDEPVFPVFYRTQGAGDGTTGNSARPLLDEGNNLQPVGFEYLAEQLELDR